jgi:hypothetical protein
MSTESNEKNDISSYIFLGSTTMVGVCITIITLFRIMKINFETFADEVLGVNTALFIVSALFSYACLRKDNKRLMWYADVFFFLGMAIMMLIGFLIVFTIY